MNLTDVIIAPIISEKSSKDAAASKFTFKVSKKADKLAIKKAVESKFTVNVVSVATMVVKGRSQRFGARRTETTMSSWKKAIVQLKPEQKIDLFETAAAK
ncbi:MAG: 50S ribosomal protein L23 [Candidatus Levybacteria bacterium]|nr:50S ribosomal protein L23 [Candidatus Levybacteria bacterium]